LVSAFAERYLIKDSNEALCEVPHEVQLAIDKWLGDTLGKDGGDYVGQLRLPCIAGSSVCIPAKVARWFRPFGDWQAFLHARPEARQSQRRLV